MLETPEDWFYASFLIIFMISSVSWLGFARISMARIERRIQEDGHVRPAAWDGLGLRVLMYANAIIWPLSRNTGNALYHHIPAIKQYATTLDRVLGTVLMVSSAVGIFLAVVGGWMLDIY